MARWTPVPVAGGAYSDDCLPWASQDTVNYIPVMAEKSGTRSPAMLRCLPGCTTFSVTGSGAPVRGVRNVEGRLLAVSGNALYRIATDGTSTSLGTIPGVARCSLAHNQVSGGNEVAIANGQSGYIYNTATDALAQITDEGFPGAKVFGFVDGYLMFVEPMGRYFGWSDLAAGTSYNTLDRSEAEAQPDRIVTGIESHGEWLVLGERTGEFYRNTGATTGTFQRIPGTTMEVGCAGTHAVGKVDNSVVWVGHDGIVYRLNGYQPQRISTHAIEQQLSRCNLAQAFITVFEDRGHKVVYITCPDGKTWGFDVATGEWHRRKSDGLDRWRMNTLTYWNGAWIAGDFSNGRLYQLDWAVQHEAGAEMERRRILPIAHDNQNRMTINAVEFVFDTGLAEEAAPLLAPLSLSGDLTNAYLGTAVSYQYTVAGGLPARVVTVLSGALPTGLSISTSGLVTGTTSAIGSFSWVLRVTDENGDTVDLADASAVVYRATWLMAENNTYVLSDTGTDWSAATATFAGTNPLTAGIGILAAPAVGFLALDQGRSYFSTSGSPTWTRGGARTYTGAATPGVYAGGYFFVPANTTGLYRTADGIAYTLLTQTAGTITGNATKLFITETYSNNNSNVKRSTDSGASWLFMGSFMTPPTSVFCYSQRLVLGGTRLVVIYGNNTTSTFQTKYSDDDGVTWSAPATVPFTSAVGTTNTLLSYASETGVWVAAAENATGQIAYSLDNCATWTLSASTLGAGAIGLDNDGTLFVMVGLTGKIATSTTGVTWTARASSFSGSIRGVAAKVNEL